MTRAAVLGAGSWGTAFAQVLVDAGTDTVLWARRPEIAAAITATRRNPDYLPEVELSTGAPGDLRPGRGAGRRRARRRRHPVPDGARQPRPLRRHAPARRGAGQPHEGDRARHEQADERGHRRGRRRTVRAHHGHHRAEPRAGDRRPPAGGRRGRLHRPERGGAGAACLQLRLLPALHQPRRARLRARWRAEERHRARRRHRRRAGVRRQRAGVAHHPWSRRDGSVGAGVGCRTADVRRARRGG